MPFQGEHLPVSGKRTPNAHLQPENRRKNRKLSGTLEHQITGSSNMIYVDDIVNE
jgi:predicted amidophosphoribosyltransferase